MKSHMSFVLKNYIFTCKTTPYLQALKIHCCYGYMINHAFHSKKKTYQSEMVRYFIRLYIINRTLHSQLGLQNVENKFHSVICCTHSWNIFQWSKRHIVSLLGHEISSIFKKTKIFTSFKESPCTPGGYSGFQVMGMIGGFFWVWNFRFRDFFGYKNLA